MVLPTDATTNAGVAGAPYPVSLGGRPYMIDLSRDGGFVERTIPLLRNQADTGGQLAEQSLNPEDLSRRSAEAWHLGMGQTYRDREDSDPARYFHSQLVDPFRERWELSLCKDSTMVEATAATTPTNVAPKRRIMGVGASTIFALDGAQTIRRAQGEPTTATWSTITGTPAATCMDMANDGYTGYFAWRQVTGTASIYSIDIADTAATQLFTLAGADLLSVGYVMGRLLCGDSAGNLYNPTDFTTPPNALPAPLMTLSGVLSEWLGFAEGTSHIYMAARDGGKFSIYKTAIKPDGTALDIPTVAASLPKGEKIVGLTGYLGLVVIGVAYVDETQDGLRQGARLCQAQGDGNLVVGPVIDLGPNDNGSEEFFGMFETHGRYVFAAASHDYGDDLDGLPDNDRAGVTRLNLENFVEDLAPAVANHISAPAGTDWCSGVTYWTNGPAFLIDGVGVHVPTGPYVGLGALEPEGSIRLGKFTYGVVDDKVAMYVDLLLDGAGTVEIHVSIDGGAYALIDTVTAPGAFTVDLDALSGSEFELRLHLLRSAGDATLGPIIRRATLRSFVNASRTREWILPIILKPRVTQNHGGNTFLDVRAEVDAIAALVGTVAVLKVGTKTEYVQVKDFQWSPDWFDEESGQFGGTCLVKAQVVA